MRLRRCSLAALVALATFTAPAAGQYPLRGIVRSSESVWPVVGAEVSLLRDTLPDAPVIRRTRSGADGRFALDAPEPGAYVVRVRHIGSGMRRVPVSLPAADSLVVTMSFHAARGTYYAARARYRDSALAAARARPRRWTCEQRRDVTAAYAHSWLRLVDVSLRNPDASHEEGIPRDTAAFLRDFRPVRDRAECVRLARALDAEVGLVDDVLVVFRIGRVYLLPELGEGMMADRRGHVIVRFVTPD